MAERKRKDSSRSHSPTSCPPLPKTVRTETVTYRTGAIRRIILHNFLTFDDVEVCPSPQLNVIVGPNGTGKSSLVCAMCLGLAGSTTILGRAKDLKDFVKHSSARDGYIEITLHHSSGNHPTIRREINKDRNSSKWLINGQERRECEVIQLVKDFKIQLENKCQFLPQDKVVEFAKLDCFQMLEETEKAIGTNNMFELHQILKTMKDKKLAIERKLGGQHKDLETLKRENQLLERDVIRIRTRQECLTKVKYLKWKKCWLEYDEARLKYQESRSTRKEKESHRRAVHDRYEPLKEKLKSNEAIVQNFQNIEKEQNDKACNIERKLSEKQRELVNLQDEQDDTGKEYENKKIEEENRLKKINRLQGEIESFTHEMEKLEPAELIYPRMKSIDVELQEIRHKMNEIQSRQQILYEERQHHHQQIEDAKEELHKMEDVFKQRLKKLDDRDHHTFMAIKWLKENKEMFEKPVHEPVIVMLHIKELKYAPQIEHFFLGKDAFSFIFESKKDYDIFAREVRDKKNLKVNMVLAPNKRLQDFKSTLPLHILRQFGFKHMLINLVEAPEAVLSYFCAYYRLHDVPVADEAHVDRFVDNHHSIQRFYTGDQVYFVTRSRYSSKTITKSVHVRGCTFFVSSVNEVERATLLADIKEATDKISLLDKELSQYQQRDLDLRQQDGNSRRIKNDLKEVLNNRARLKRSRESKHIQMQQLQNSPVNIEIESHKYKESLTNLITKKTQCLEKVSQYTKVYRDHLIAKSHAYINFTEADLHKKSFESQFESITSELKDAESGVNQAKQDEINSKERAHQLMDVARRVTGFRSPNELSPETAAMFQGLPNDLSSIEDQIHDNQTQADMCSDVDHNGEAIIEQFETRDAEIKKLESLVEKQDDELRRHQEETEKLKQQWLEPLKGMMEDINSRFSHFFALMDCAGEVSLLTHDYDFSKYGVQIRVKFRSEDELHVLDAHRQSGGERSVSTMMYLMALQEITSCPFRVVDEINQGMDSANERRVFDLIVDTVRQTDTSQYFLLTPKLLQGLKYSSCVAVHFVHNGPELMHHSKWSY